MVGGYVAVDREGVGSLPAAGVWVGVFHALDAAMFVTTSRTALGYEVAGTGVRGLQAHSSGDLAGGNETLR